MSEKTKELLQKLKEITEKSPTQSAIEGVLVSNLGGDRIYSNFHGSVYLINKDNSYYRGKIHRRSVMIQSTCSEAFRSYVYETSDGRWFDRSGMPTEVPKKLEKDDFETTNEESSKVA
jgi:hypothetical protein